MRAWFRNLVKNTVVNTLTPDELNAGVTPGWAQMFEAQLNPTLRGHYARNPAVPLTDIQRGRLARHRIEELPPSLVPQANSRAGLIVERTTLHGQVVLFGLITEDDEHTLNFVEPVVLCYATGSTKDLAGTADKLQQWYRGLLLDKRVIGRTRGSTIMTREEFMRRQREVRAEWMHQYGRSPTDIELAEELSISTDTLSRYRKRFS